MPLNPACADLNGILDDNAAAELLGAAALGDAPETAKQAVRRILGRCGQRDS
jgi:hypothetical protein